VSETTAPTLDESNVSDDENNAFSNENFNVVLFTTQARILDVLYALLQDANPGKHRDLLEAHANGLLLGPAPVFEGRFITDEENLPPDL
jgi:hypothetical protein